MEENYQFPNLIVGMLTRESLKEAFKKKITARQIMNFLEQHAHPECRKSQAQIAQQRSILEKQNKTGAQSKKVLNLEGVPISSGYFEMLKT